MSRKQKYAAASLAALATILLAGPVLFSQSAAEKAPKALTPERIKELQAADKDILGNLELAKKDDPSYEAVAGIMPGMKKPREVIGVRYHPHDIGVAVSPAFSGFGRSLWNGDWVKNSLYCGSPVVQSTGTPKRMANAAGAMPSASMSALRPG